MAEPGDEMASGAGDGSRLPVYPAHREQVIRTLEAALAQGRLTEDEHDARAAQASASRSHAELAALTADLPAGLAITRLPAASDVRAGICVVSADFHTGGSGQLSCELVADGTTAPPGDGGVGWQVC